MSMTTPTGTNDIGVAALSRWRLKRPSAALSSSDVRSQRQVYECQRIMKSGDSMDEVYVVSSARSVSLIQPAAGSAVLGTAHALRILDSARILHHTAGLWARTE